MIRISTIALVLGGTITAAAWADTPVFRWKAGQSLVYRVSQSTTAHESLKDSELMVTTTQLDAVKRWQVLEVDAAGVATLQMTLVSLRMETRPPNGEGLLFDSKEPQKGTEGLREELAKYIGPPLTVIQLDARGRLVAVKESKFGPPSRLECDLPFKVVFGAADMTPGQTWDRLYAIKLEPPQGAGETFDALQRYTCKALANGQAVIGVLTEVKKLPETAAERLPLLPLIPSGEVHFDLSNGRLRAVRYQFQHELADHRGEGSKYSFKSTYAEDLIDAR